MSLIVDDLSSVRENIFEGKDLKFELQQSLNSKSCKSVAPDFSNIKCSIVATDFLVKNNYKLNYVK